MNSKHISDTMQAGSRMSLLQLPAESLDRIFRLLPLDNLALLMLVCTRFRQVVLDTLTTVTIDTTLTTGTGERLVIVVTLVTIMTNSPCCC